MKVASNRIQDVYRHYVGELEGLYASEEAGNLIALLIEEYAGLKKTEIFLDPGSPINESDLLRVHFAVKALKDYKPVQQIIGYTMFCGCRIGVNENVLIPRPETEEMVEEIKKEKFPHAPRILDIGSGSAAIAIALKKHFPQGSVFALEKSGKAILKATENAAYNQAEIKFFQMDLFDKDIVSVLPSELDLIVSNPPYVRESEKAAMRPNVLEHEPDDALFVPDDNALIFYERIVDLARELLANSGIMYFEINEALGRETANVFMSSGYQTKLLKDLFGKDRFIKARKI